MSDAGFTNTPTNRLICDRTLPIATAGVCAAGLVVAGLNFFPSILVAIIFLPLFLLLLFWLVKSPWKCVLALVVVLPLESAAVLNVGFTIRLAYLAAGLLIASMWVVSRRFTVLANITTAALGLYALVALISLTQTIIYPPPQLLSINPELELRASVLRSFVQVFLLLLHVISFVCALGIINEKRHLQIIIRLYVSIAVIVALYGLYQPIATAYDLPLKDITNALNTSGVGYGGVPRAGSAVIQIRPRSTFSEAGHFGQYLVTALALILAYNPFTRRNAGLLRFVCISILSWGIIVTVTRGTYLSLGSVLLLLFLTRARRLSMPGVKSLVISVLLFVCLVFPMIGLRSSSDISFFTAIFDRFLIEKVAEDPRHVLLDTVFSVWSEHPLLGVGLGSYGAYAGTILGSDKLVTAQGVWWSVLVETGILGFAVFAWFIISVIGRAMAEMNRSKDLEMRAILAGLFTAVCGAMFAHLFFGDRLSTFVWFLLIMATAATEIARRKRLSEAQRTADAAVS